jgi:nitrogen regulatory protein PII-like uncharacterized protein
LKSKITIIVLTVLLIISITLNVLSGRASLSYFDNSYRDLANTYIFNIELLEYLNSSDFEVAQKILVDKTGTQALMLGICVMEECSNGMIEVFLENEVDLPKL